MREKELIAVLALLPAVVLGVPNLSADAVTGAPGQTVAVPLRLTGTAPASAGFNATVHLPRGMVLADVLRGGLLPAPDFRLAAHSLLDPSVNAFTLLAYSTTQTLSATGTLCTLLVAIPADAGPGDYPVLLDVPDRSPPVPGHAFSSADGSSSLAHVVGNGLLSVRMSGTPGDSNGNGIPDDWESLFFGAITNVTDQTDFDRDGLSDFREYLSGTDPTDPNSCAAIVPPRPGPEDGGIRLRWHSISGGTYRIERAAALLPGDFSRVGLDQSATPPLNVYTDHPPADDATFFYRLIRLED